MNFWKNPPTEFYIELLLNRRANVPFLDFHVKKTEVFYKISVFNDGIFCGDYYVDFQGELLFYKVNLFSKDFIKIILADGQVK
jgi:hypothetical protein